MKSARSERPSKSSIESKATCARKSRSTSSGSWKSAPIAGSAIAADCPSAASARTPTGGRAKGLGVVLSPFVGRLRPRHKKPPRRFAPPPDSGAVLRRQHGGSTEEKDRKEKRKKDC